MLNNKIRNFGSILLMLFIIFSSMQSVSAANGIIESMNEVSPLLEDNGTVFYQSNGDQGDRIVILYEEDSDNNIGKLGLKEEDIQAGKTIDDRVDVLLTSGQTETEALLTEIESNEAVKAADYDDIVHAVDIPNDHYYEQTQKQAFEQTKADKTVLLGLKNRVKVAVLDTGLDANHEDIAGRYLLEGYNFVDGNTDTDDDNGHGTAVSGIISCNTNNGIGLAGYAGTSNVTIIPYKTLGSDGSGRISGIIAAIQAVNKTDIPIINLSLGIDKSNGAFKAAVEDSYIKGKILVAASGNYGSDSLLYPARYDQTISVGAVSDNNQRCTAKEWGSGNGSNYGEGLDIMAPGNDIAVIKNGSYFFSSGTSNACPIVSAAIALMLAENPKLNFVEIYNILTSTATDLGNPGYDVEYGYGLINFEKAVTKAAGQSTPTESIECKPNQLKMVKNQISTLQTVTNSNKSIKWSSSNTRVATVSNGKVQAVGPGNAVITATLNGTDTSAKVNVTVSNIDILAISAHCQDVGWKPAVTSMATAGTTGMHKQLEALRINANDPDLNINTQVHVSNVGDMPLVGDNAIAGTTGQALGIEAVRFILSGTNAQNYSLYYRVHVENYGWTDWAPEGSWNGTRGHNLQLEAVELCIVKKGESKPNVRGNVNWIYM